MSNEHDDYDAEIAGAQAELQAANKPGGDPSARKPAYERIMAARAAKMNAKKESTAAAERMRNFRRPYPVNDLGETMGDAAMAIAHKSQVPIAIAANSLLACASVAAQAVANIRMNHGAITPLSLHLVTAALSGERKSTADNEAKTALNERQKELAKEFGEFEGDYLAAKHSWDVEKRKISEEKDYAKRTELLQAHQKREPVPPPGSMLTFDDGSVQGIAKAFRTEQPALGLLNNEAGMFVAGHAFKDENKVQSGALLSKFWDGASVDRLLVGEGRIKAHDKRLALHGMIQPGVARDFLCDPQLTDQGYAARLLIAWPESRIGYRPELAPYATFSLALDDKGATRTVTVAEILKRCEQNIAAYNAKLSALLKASRVQPDRNIDFRLLRLSSAANDLRRDFYNTIETESRPNGRYRPVHANASKTVEQAYRIVGVRALLDDPGVTEIGVDAMQSACLLARWYLDEALRVRETASEAPEIEYGRALLDWVKSRPEDDTGGWTVPMRDVQRLGPYAMRKDGKAREQAVESLISVGVAIWRGSLGSPKSRFFVPVGATL